MSITGNHPTFFVPGPRSIGLRDPPAIPHSVRCQQKVLPVNTPTANEQAPQRFSPNCFVLQHLGPYRGKKFAGLVARHRGPRRIRKLIEDGAGAHRPRKPARPLIRGPASAFPCLGSFMVASELLRFADAGRNNTRFDRIDRFGVGSSIGY